MPPLDGHRNGLPADPARPSRNGKPPAAIPVDWERLARATVHPMRISILEVLGIDGGRTLSPIDLSRELQVPLSNTNYHVTELAKAGLIKLVARRPVRGATEHFYRLTALPSPDRPASPRFRLQERPGHLRP